MPDQELRFVHIAVANAVTPTGTALLHLYGLTGDGLVYEWAAQHQRWIAVPMKPMDRPH